MYTGICERETTDEELAKFYEGNVKYDLFPNQYLLLKREGVIIDKYKADKDGE